ncbi:glycine-rich domain-containing protein [Rhodococcus rhodochrous]|uniref:glycine-rich domain-containing protein n=1 Tax=Rhodococcus rhodochrous TaxID=1829 RepID=UPI00177C354C|nr:hypothetical protein [Rhodococcus rhodochrous]QOH59875.1 hypothetical protein C6Y44_27685 [Rhodococcus rhodochrous]
MIADRILDGFGKFITTANFEDTLGAEVDARMERALAPFGEMIAELEKRSGYVDLENAEIVTLIADQRWEKPVGFNRFHVICIGAGAGGATGHFDALWGAHYGRGGGGGGGCDEKTFTDLEMPDFVDCTIGVGGAGAVNGGNGSRLGASGTQSAFGDLLVGGGGKGDGTGGSGNSPGGSGGGPGRAGSPGTQGNVGGSAGGGGGGQNAFSNKASNKAGEGGRSGTLPGGPAGAWVTSNSSAARPAPGRDAGEGQFYGGSGGGGGGGRGPGGHGGMPGGGGGAGGIDGTGGKGADGCIHIICFYE